MNHVTFSTATKDLSRKSVSPHPRWGLTDSKTLPSLNFYVLVRRAEIDAKRTP